ncbi:MAG: hypothetical protein IJ400_03335 [Clostridia bacterium]|nr:hypothetical protein [Clostridia bacterium]
MVTLNSIFSSNMVLQANKPVRFFGSGQGSVEVTLLGNTKTLEAKGDWLIEFDPVSYGGPYTIDIKLNGICSQLRDVYFGDVYLLGGQSNMQFKLKECNEPVSDYRGNDNVRMFTVDRLELSEYYFSRDGWVVLTKENAGEFSSIGYYVSQELATDERKIGLIACYQGASAIQPWIRKDLADKFPTTLAKREYPLWNDNGKLYEKMLSNIIPFSISHVLWYQGESNAYTNEAELYIDMLSCMVDNWREDFRDFSIKFVIVQIANYIWGEDKNGWKAIQELQLKASDCIEGLKTVVCHDICEDDDIHPKSKKVLSQRIAKAIEG